MGSLPLTSEPFDWVPDAKPTLRLDANEQIGLRALTLTTGGQWKNRCDRLSHAQGTTTAIFVCTDFRKPHGKTHIDRHVPCATFSCSVGTYITIPGN